MVSPSVPRASFAQWSSSFRFRTTRPSCSAVATTRITSTRMPKRRFMTVKGPVRRKHEKSAPTTTSSWYTKRAMETRSLAKQPLKIKLNMACGNVLKYWFPAGVSTAICVSAIAKTYTIIKPRSTVRTTERVAAPMARTRIKTSGRKRSILAIRATRVRRSSLIMRRTDESKKMMSSFVKLSTMNRAQVSRIMKKARKKSKRNQKSRSARSLFLKATKRITISMVNAKHSRFSTMIMPGSALISSADSLIVDSMPIQTEFSRITNIVACSNQ
mmetsp:Transcript_8515/g.20196  ORF Transcript_8515/g.20196 Transcript_8515/m.20196 type:complete len:272 (-) Transcript_8515:574-1389(-)